MKLPFKKRTWGYFAATVVVAGLFFSTTNPERVSSLWLVAGFCLTVALLYWAARAAVVLAGFYIKPVAAHRQRLVKAVTLVSAIVVAMQSAGQLTVKDIAVLVPLATVGYLYVSYARRPVPNR